MQVYVEVAVNIPQVSGTFDYHLPAEMEADVQAGCLVIVPFGQQTVQGIVTRRISEPSVAATRAVISLVDPVAVLTDSQIQLARWLAETTLSPLAGCIDLMLPPGLAQQADTHYTLRALPDDQDLSDLNSIQMRLINILKKRGSLRGGQIDAAMPRLDWRPSARSLVRRGLILTQSILPAPRVQPKFVRSARLSVTPETAEKALSSLAQPVRKVRLVCSPTVIEDRMDELGKVGSAALSRRQAMMRFLLDADGLVELQGLYAFSKGTYADLERLIQLGLAEIVEVDSPKLERRQAMLRTLLREPGEIQTPWLYAESGGNLDDLYALEERGLVMLGESEVFRDPLTSIEVILAQSPSLTHDQVQVWQTVRSQIHNAVIGTTPPPILLHGVTGSGKTEIYLRAVQDVLDSGRQAIVLVPEIALTPQTVRRFVGRFPGRVGLVHSALSPGERYDTWRRARTGSLSVVVGPRSALFTPFQKLGLIVVDECHDDSYYQADIRPHYHAIQTAIAYARLVGAVCLLGSATPDITSFTQLNPEGKVTSKNLLYLRLPKRILAHREAVQAQLERLGKDGEIQSLYHPYEAQSETIELPEVQILDMREELKAGNRSIFSTDLQESLNVVLRRQQQAILFLNSKRDSDLCLLPRLWFDIEMSRL